MRVGMAVNLDKPRAAEVAAELGAWLQRAGVEAVFTPAGAERIGWRGPVAELRAMADHVAFVAVLGGDGTLLAVARGTLPGAPPLLGVNLGRLGFLTELEVPELYDCLPLFLSGRGRLDERTMLTGTVGPSWAPDLVALNDLVIAKGPAAHVLRVRILVDGELLGAYRGDGIIVATPTGSTAYALSAGGPVLDPALPAVVVTPICPHTFDFRPTVVAGERTLRVEVEAEHDDIVLIQDGQQARPFVPGTQLHVRLGPAVARLLRRPAWTFYEVLRRKIAAGDAGAGEP